MGRGSLAGGIHPPAVVVNDFIRPEMNFRASNQRRMKSG
jgi:hypothetical protein